MSFDPRLMQIYVADHRAASAAVAGRLEQMTAYTHLPFVREIEQMHHDVLAEGTWLDALARRHGFRGGKLKKGGALIGERLGRLKLNGRLRTMSPLTPLIETEMLIAAIAANITFLQTLTGLPELDIDADELTELSDQAHQHFEHATRWHRRLRVDAFTSSA